MSSASSRKYPPELRERAVRMVAECRHEHPSEWATIESVAQKLGIGTAQTLLSWVRREQVESGRRGGVTSDMAAEMRKLRAENKELKRANEMADSTGSRNKFCELLRWCHISERLAWSAIEGVLDRGQLGAADDAQVGALRQVLA